MANQGRRGGERYKMRKVDMTVIVNLESGHDDPIENELNSHNSVSNDAGISSIHIDDCIAKGIATYNM